MKEEQKPKVHTPGVPVPPSARRTQRPPLSGMGVRDIRQTKEYKVAARRYVSFLLLLYNVISLYCVSCYMMCYGPI